MIAMFFHAKLPEILADAYQRHALHSMLFALEARRNYRFATGHNLDIKPIAPFINPIVMAHRPLIFYLLVAGFGKIADFVLALSGFHSYSPTEGKTLGYKHHPGLANPASGLLCYIANHWLGCKGDITRMEPIIFLHGLGGYAPLTPFILALLPLGRPIFLVEQPHISFKLGLFTQNIPTITQMVDSVHGMLSTHGHGITSSKPTIIAHSLGSGLASALNDNSAHSMKFNTLYIDPISIRLSDPHLARAYSACPPQSAFAQIIRYFTLEPGAAEYVSRHFDPFSSSLDLHPDSPRTASNTRVILSRNDFLIPVNAIAGQCEVAGVRCTILENTNHGGWLFSLPLFMGVLGLIRELVVFEEEKKVDLTTSRTLIDPTVTRPRSTTLTKPAITRSSLVSFENYPSNPLSTSALNRMSRTRSRTLTMCDTVMAPCKTVRISEGVSKEMRKMGSAAGLVY
jgi:hypothetical protein